MKSESLVIAGQHTAVNTFPGLVHTARHTTKVGNTRSRWPNPVRGWRFEVKSSKEEGKEKKLAQPVSPTANKQISNPEPRTGKEPSKVGPMIGVKS